MKVRTQNADKIVGFGDAYIAIAGLYGAVYIRSQYNGEGIQMGVYEDISRAKGVLHEMALAFERGANVFYMPAE